MNIFVLDKTHDGCVRYLVDKHVVKMPLETAQLLCTAHRELDGDGVVDTRIYKSTHKNHPCALWVRETFANYLWTYILFTCLCKEYEYRYGKTHLCWSKLGHILSSPPTNIPHGPQTPFALCMPDECKISNDPVECYREYYIKHKSGLFTWSARETPHWIKKDCENV